MGEETSRDAVLAGIRRANAAGAADGLRPFGWPASAPTRNALVERFVARAEAVQATVTVVRDFAEARKHVAALLAHLACDRPAVSDDARRSPWDMPELPLDDRPDDHSPTALADAAVGITGAAYGLADTGTIVVCSGPAGGRAESLLPPVHIALLNAADLVASLPELLAALERDRRFDQSSAVTFITGPSRTADIELTLTIGVHGPKQLFIVVVNDTNRT
jgi:L-lactate dehydrogenase complex protein LldG